MKAGVATVKPCLALVVVGIVLQLTAACQQQSEAEQYQPVANPRELGLNVEVVATRVAFGNSAGGRVEGKVAWVTIAGKELELTNDEILQDDGGSWIATKAYGRIKIAPAAPGRGLAIALTPSQKARLTELYKATELPPNAEVRPQNPGRLIIQQPNNSNRTCITTVCDANGANCRMVSVACDN